MKQATSHRRLNCIVQGSPVVTGGVQKGCGCGFVVVCRDGVKWGRGSGEACPSGLREGWQRVNELGG